MKRDTLSVHTSSPTHVSSRPFEHGVDELFTPDFARRLKATDDVSREKFLKAAIADAAAALPHAMRQLVSERNLVFTALDRTLAEQLAEFRMPLVDGSAPRVGLPYDWYMERHEDHGEKAPRFIVQRIDFAGTLIKAHRNTGEIRFAQALRDYFADYTSRYWTDSTVLPTGDNWLCSAVRCCILCESLHELSSLPIFSTSDLLAIFRTVTNILNGLSGDLALGSNWRVHELTGLLTLGVGLPFLKDAARWREIAVNGLNEEFEIQFHQDGSHEELSIHYGCSIYYAYAFFFAISKQAPELGLCFDEGKLERIQEYYISSVKPFGLSAGIGDVYAMRTVEMLSHDSAPITTDAYAARSPAERWPEHVYQSVRLIDPHVRFASSRFVLDGKPAPTWTSRFHPSSGYLYLRDGWLSDSLYLNANLGYHANCHCHYSLLGIEAAGYGREFIVDPGNSEMGGRPIDDNFRRTRGHSTMTVDGRDQQTTSPVSITRLFLGERYDFVLGAYRGGYVEGDPFRSWHDGFAAQHFRHILFVKGAYWIVFDAMNAPVGRTVETRFQFMPNAMRPLANGGYATGWQQSNLALVPLKWDGWEHAVLEGREDPIEGWLPGQKKEFVPAPVYKATKKIERSPVWHGSLLFPYREATLPSIEVTPIDVGDAGFAYRIRTAAFTDLFFLSNSWLSKPIRVERIETDAPCFHARLVDGKLARLFVCEGNFLRDRSTEIFCAPGTMLAREFGLGGCMVSAIRNPRHQDR